MARRRARSSGPCILAADTSTLTQSLALTRGERAIATLALDLPRGHSRVLLAAIDELLGRAGLQMERVDALAIGVGPGSFTGLRIGMALFKGIALGHEIPLWPASSLQAIAREHAWFDGYVCPCIDARKGQIYTALFRGVPSPSIRARSLETVLEERVIAPKALADDVLFAAPGDAPILFVGTGAEEYDTTLRTVFGDRARLRLVDGHPRAAHIARQVLPRLERETAPGLATLEPRYIRPSDAELGPAGPLASEGEDAAD